MNKWKIIHFTHKNRKNGLFNKETAPASAFTAKLALAPPPAASRSQPEMALLSRAGGRANPRSIRLTETLSVIKQYISQPRMIVETWCRTPRWENGWGYPTMLKPKFYSEPISFYGFIFNTLNIFHSSSAFIPFSTQILRHFPKYI